MFMKLFITLLIAILLILFIFFHFKDNETFLAPKKSVESEPKLIDNFINTNLPKTYEQNKTDLNNVPQYEPLKKKNKESDIGVEVDFNKDTKELEKLKFNFNKNF